MRYTPHLPPRSPTSKKVKMTFLCCFLKIILFVCVSGVFGELEMTLKSARVFLDSVKGLILLTNKRKTTTEFWEEYCF